MSKQDRQGVRTATQLEQKYGFGESFANVYKLIDEMGVDNEKALAELDKSLTPEEIFNRLTGYGKYQGVYRGADGNLYVNAEYISGGTIKAGLVKVEAATITGQLDATQINAANLKVNAANIIGTLTAGQIDATNLKVSAANVTGLTAAMLNAGFVDADTISADYVLIEDLENGNTSIDGGCIDTGEVLAAYIRLYSAMAVYKSRKGSVGGYLGYVEGEDQDGDVTSGIGMSHEEEAGYGGGYCMVTSSGARMGYDGGELFGCSSSNIFASQEVSVSSDERVKNTIVHDVAERYEEVYRKLQPARFKYNTGTSDRFHTGFIAQELEQAIKDGGLTNQDLAALVHFNEEEGGRYAIRYGELIALNTAMVQKLMDKIDALEAEIKQLKGE